MIPAYVLKLGRRSTTFGLGLTSVVSVNLDLQPPSCAQVSGGTSAAACLKQDRPALDLHYEAVLFAFTVEADAMQHDVRLKEIDQH